LLPKAREWLDSFRVSPADPFGAKENQMIDPIPGFPDFLMQRHMNWHTNPGHPELGGRQFFAGTPGSGQEFLDFHHQYIIDFRAWYDAQPGHDDSEVTPWPAFPADLTAFDPGLPPFETQVNNTSAFASEDDLGRFIEPTHNSVHGDIAQVYNAPDMSGFMSPQNSLFYNWHGLVDAWRQNWLDAHTTKNHIKEIIDSPKVKDLTDAPNIKDILDSVPRKNVEIPPKLKDAEVPNNPMFAEVLRLSARVSQLELQAASGRAFIQPQERPRVGG
jgi:hypothetical protein